MDDADHRVLRPAGRRPGAAGLARAGQADAAQLDRPLARGAGVRSPPAGRRHGGADRGLHDPARHAVRRDVHGAGARAPAGGLAGAAGGWPDGTRDAWTGGSATPAEAVAAYRLAAVAQDATSSGRARARTRPVCSPGRSRPTRSTARRSPSSSPTTSSWATAPAPSWPCPARTSATGSSPRSSTCRCVRTVQPTPGHSEDEAFTGDGPAINSANDEISLDGMHVAEAKATIIDWLQEQGFRRAARSPTSCATGCSAGSATGASRSRSSTTRTALPVALPESMLPLELPEVADYSPKTFAPDDAQSSPSRRCRGRTEWVNVELDLGDGPKKYRRETEHHAQLGRFVLVRAALPGPGQPRAVRRPGGRAVLDGPAHRDGGQRPGRRGRPGRRRPLRRWRRARGAAPAVLPLLAQGAVRPGARVQRGAVPPAVQPGLRPGLRLPRRPRPAGAGRRGARERRRRTATSRGPGRTSRYAASTARWASR